MENVNHNGKFLNLYFEFKGVFEIQFRDSFDKEKQTKWLKSVARFVGKN